MSAIHQYCPVVGCGMRRDNLSKRGGSNRRWYSVASSRHLLVGQLDEALTALPCNDHICPNCYKRIRRPPSLAHGLLDDLAAAAEEHPPSPPPLPSSLSSLSPPLPPPPSPSAEPTSVPQQPSSPSPSRTAPRALSLTSARFSPRRSWSFKEKAQICTEWKAASTVAEKQAVRTTHRAQQLDGHQVKKWTAQLALNESSPKGVKAALSKSRRRASGRPTQLTRQSEAGLYEWIMEKRHKRLQVKVYEIQAEALRRHPLCRDGITPFQAGDQWASGFMERWKLSVRLATTNKAVSTPDMRRVQFHFRNKLAAEYHDVNPLFIYNMDETSVTLDAPGLRTVAPNGSKCVEIATTGHEFTRVAIVICVSRGGEMVTPLVIRKGGKTSRYYQKFFHETHGGTSMWVTENKKAWLDSASMAVWIEEVYVPFIRFIRQQRIGHTHLFMDNCSVHDSEVSMTAMARHQVQCTFFPPNCTPILQPCDQNVNHVFKLQYEKRWAAWFDSFGHTEANVTVYGNPAAAKVEEYMKWIGEALQSVDKKVIEDSWQMSCAGYQASVFHLPSKLWLRVLTYVDSSRDSEQLQHVSSIRKLYTAWHGYTFPVKKKRKAAPTEWAVVTTSNPSKKRKGGTVMETDDGEEEEMKDSESDKENRTPNTSVQRELPWERDVIAVDDLAAEADWKRKVKRVVDKSRRTAVKRQPDTKKTVESTV